MKKIVRLTEGDLVRIIKKVISENDPKKQKTQPGELEGTRTKLSKLKNNLELFNKAFNYVPNFADIDNYLAKYNITPQKDAKIKRVSNETANDVVQFFLAVNAYILKRAEDTTIPQFCETYMNQVEFYCKNDPMAIMIGKGTYSQSTKNLELFDEYRQMKCPLFAKLAVDFGYSNTPDAYLYIKNKLSQMVNDHVKEVIRLAGYTCK